MTAHHRGPSRQTGNQISRTETLAPVAVVAETVVEAVDTARRHRDSSTLLL